jgi:DNA polymerase III subunit gamma/tau
MEHVALYRELRPQLFSEVVGQEPICRTLRNSVRSGRLSHAYLFCGPRGTGKTSTARILAKAVNCAYAKDGEPCNECESCRTITAGTALDVLEMDAASNRGIDEVRDLKQKVGFVPTVGKRRVYIIDEVHMLTGEAFNALLKTLEEPPAHGIFILATTEAHKVPPTVSSRCQRFEFRRLGHDLIREHLAGIADGKGWTVEPGALDILVRQAGGALRDSVGLLDQAASFTEGRIGLADALAITGSLDEGSLSKILDASIAGDAPALVSYLGEMLAGGHEPRQILFQLIECLRSALFSKEGRAHEEYALLLRSLACADTEMRGSGRPDLALEIALLRVAGFPTSQVERPQPSGAGRPAVVSPTTGKTDTTGPDMALPAVERRPVVSPPPAGIPAAVDVDVDRLKVFLLNHVYRHRILQQALRSCSFTKDGDRIRIAAPSSFLTMLQRPETTRLLEDGVRQFGSRLPIEVVSGVEPKKVDAPEDAESRPSLRGIDVVNYALQVFNGTPLTIPISVAPACENKNVV